jgi:hypothetical protein
MSLVRDIDSPERPVVHSPIKSSSNDLMPMKTFLITLGVAIVIGVGGGWALGHGKANASTGGTSQAAGGAGSEQTAGGLQKTAGIEDLKTFKDQAEGQMEKGGIGGEGSFHLVRPGGESQYVYLTSSTVDLSPYIGKKVRVHGQTIAGQVAGWLMDVGYLEML